MSSFELRTDVLIVGGGLGGVAVALTACRLGQQVIITEETDWLGGQLTSQAVPPDEHPWIEVPQYASWSYRQMRDRIREYYRRNYPLRASVAADPSFNPGLGNVSPLCHEPRVAVAVIDEMLAPYVASGRLRIFRRHKPLSALSNGDIIDAVVFLDLDDGNDVIVSAAYVVDATELGDLLELARVEHVIGAESRDQTGELHAPDQADVLDQQAISWCFALDYRAGEEHVIARPRGYSHWRNHGAAFWPGPQLSWRDVDPWSLATRTIPLFAGDPDEAGLRDRWHFRRILARSQFEPGAMDSDITLVNWPQIDYWERPLVGVEDSAQQEALLSSRDLSLSFLYWMQTEAPRSDGGTGYPGLRLRPDVMGTADGLAKSPYIRESRRIRATFTVVEQHIGKQARGSGTGSTIFHDSVGIGNYRIDLHPSTGGRSYIDVDCYPFQIPLGALLPVRVNNLLPANKNIGTTHITNGAYRLHPVEWSVGEAIGALISFCIRYGLPPRKVWEDDSELDNYQQLLTGTLGIPLAWPDYLRCLSWETVHDGMSTWQEAVRARPERIVSGRLIPVAER